MLNADATPVDEAHLGEPARVSFGDVVRDDRSNITRRERVQIRRSLDGYSASHHPSDCCLLPAAFFEYSGDS